MSYEIGSEVGGMVGMIVRMRRIDRYGRIVVVEGGLE